MHVEMRLERGWREVSIFYYIIDSEVIVFVKMDNVE